MQKYAPTQNFGSNFLNCKKPDPSDFWGLVDTKYKLIAIDGEAYVESTSWSD